MDALKTPSSQGVARADWPALMRAAQHGDAAAYARLLREVTPFLRAILRSKLAADHLEDVLQDTLLTIHRVRHTYDPARPFVPWLAAIAARRAIDSGRRRGRVNANESAGDSLDLLSVDPEPDTIDAQRRATWLREAIAALPYRQRAAIELVKIGELSLAEAAERTGQTQGAVKVNVHRGIAALRRLLGGREL